MPKVRFAPEGWLFIIPAVILTALSLLIQWWIAAIVFGFLSLFLLNFFRDPFRRGSERHVDVLSPADGTVVQIKEVKDGEVWPGLTRQISIFMSVFDVHVNRAPIGGRISRVEYHEGQFLPAFQDKASLANEQNSVTIDAGEAVGGHRVTFKQIAGLIARRIVFKKQVGDTVAAGERVGMIKFGSRVDVFLPRNVHLRVRKGDRVVAGVSALGERP